MTAAPAQRGRSRPGELRRSRSRRAPRCWPRPVATTSCWSAPGVGKTRLARLVVGAAPRPRTSRRGARGHAHPQRSRSAREPGSCADRRCGRPIIRSPRPGLVGGGPRLLPGEVTLAHHGVLFLDETAGIRRTALDAMREPLAEGMVRVARRPGQRALPGGIPARRDGESLPLRLPRQPDPVVQLRAGICSATAPDCPGRCSIASISRDGGHGRIANRRPGDPGAASGELLDQRGSRGADCWTAASRERAGASRVWSRLRTRDSAVSWLEAARQPLVSRRGESCAHAACADDRRARAGREPVLRPTSARRSSTDTKPSARRAAEG